MGRETGTIRVLVVDDDVATVDTVCTSLRVTGYECSSAPNGAVALERVLTFRPDVVVFDFWMPVTDGRELVLGIREVTKSRVGLVAMSGTPEVEDWCGRVGVGAFVRKPFAVDVMRAAVQRVFEEAKSPPSSSHRMRAASDPPTSRRLKLESSVLVVGEGSASQPLRGLLRDSRPPMQVAAVGTVDEAIRALGSIAVDAVAVCGDAISDPELLRLTAAAESRSIPIVAEASPCFEVKSTMRVAELPSAQSMLQSIQDSISMSRR